MEIGKRLRELRHGKGFSQGDIERLTGCLRCYTSRVENGYTVPSLETLEKYAKALDLELYQLFYDGEGKGKAPKAAEVSPVQPEVLRLFNRLTERNQRLLLEMARKMISVQ
jgi:transcriptional regulator with XRE-family HTH domain